MKKILFSAFTVAALGFVTSCSDDDPVGPDVPQGEDIIKTGIITESETWTANNIYILDGRVVVDEGTTLTIEPGTIIKAEDGQLSNASALIVDRGAKLVANGTADKPIIFTSVNDEIQPGETESVGLEVEDAGQWGGVIVLGNAPISVAASGGVGYIEGIPAGLSYGEYGGEDAADNSGSLKYLSIRFSGIALEQDAEIQGLTLGGVGSGTTIENIEIFSNKDDGIEFFGGSVNVKNILIYGQEDDGLDVDQAYSGTVDNALVIQTANSGSALEIDGPEGNAGGSFTFKNLTINMNNIGGKLIGDFRDGATGTLENVFVFNISADGSTVNINDEKSVVSLNGDKIKFSNIEVVSPDGKSISDLFTTKGETSPIVAKFTDNVTAVVSGSETVGANLTVFDWTLSKSKNLL
ncbi:hypothetical protein HP439_12520 [Sphingobacterium shayense]|uniref:hypothetical protein n=1 Tax=Sphingobacterium shayense TaxID=626343 RepID=UPI0015576E88|nr:hypothetical protein [Sphingobacterium shayense]NQD71549.1 hypothetical protein [Sphingobacterium shayense]